MIPTIPPTNPNPAIESIKLKDGIVVRGRFHRSVQLEKDWTALSTLENYLVTPTSHDIAERLCVALKGRPDSDGRIGTAGAGAGAVAGAGAGAWSITGPYGSGKSAFALFLTDMLARYDHMHPLAEALRREFEITAEPLLPVLIVGHRAPMVPALLSSLSGAMRPISVKLARRIDQAAKSNEITSRQVSDFFQAAANEATANGRGGLLVAIDEFGKFLEYAAVHPETEDLMVMQELAEAATRSSSPLMVITILHTAFAEYARNAEDVRQAEWRKVQGRFTDIAFLEPPEQLLALVCAALDRSLPLALEQAYTEAVTSILQAPALTEARHRFPVDELLPGCAPLHPVVALLLWPIFRSKLAQHERSLFSFLTSREPYGFQEFLDYAQWDGISNTLPFYTVDNLYDYITTSLGAATFRGDHARRWAEIDHALSKVGADAPTFAPAVIKAVGLLGLYGFSVGLKASAAVLGTALGDANAVADAIAYLQARSILILRKHEGAYGLWEGSDVDLEARYGEGKQNTKFTSLASRLKDLVALTPVVARAHYIETGTLRYFVTDVIDAPGNPTDLLKLSAGSRKHSQTEGRITYVLVRDHKQREALVDYALHLTGQTEHWDPLHILAFPKPVAGLEEAIDELEVWRWVDAHTPALQGDPVARQEVRAQITKARQHLEALAGPALGLRGYAFDPRAIDWVQGGRVHPELATSRLYLSWLSELCNQIYHCCPGLHNELLNRDHLSSSATAARRNLIQAMLSMPHVERLGIQGTPAEASMYASLLAEGGFHQQRSGQWAFGEPDTAWLPVWKIMDDFLASTHSGRRPVVDLYATLSRPPLGLRQGPLPVLLCALLLARKGDVALYERRGFIPEITIEVLERLTRNPADFEIQEYAMSPQERVLFIAMHSMISDLSGRATQTVAGTAEDSAPALIDVVKALMLFVSQLKPYVKNTRRLTPKTVAVRDTLLQAADPYQLLFTDLPNALGIPVDIQLAVDLFVDELSSCLQELHYAYGDLLDSIEQQIAATFGLDGTYETIGVELRRRATLIEGYAVESGLAVFARAASHLDRRDWREVLGVAVQKGMPPAQWRDRDLAEFQVRLQQIHSDFVRIEELVLEQQQSSATQVLRIGVLNGHVKEAREIISMSPELQPVVEQLVQRVTTALAADTSSGSAINDPTTVRRVRIAALAQLAATYLLGQEATGARPEADS